MIKMTYVFTFPIKNAWVCVADRLTTDKKFLDVNVEGGRVERIRMDNITKIEELSKNLVFVGAGSSEILRIITNNLDVKVSFGEFKKDLHSFLKTLYGKYGRDMENTEFIIIDQRNKKAYKFNVSKILNSDSRRTNNGICKISSCEQGFMGDDDIAHLDNAKTKLLRRETHVFRKSSPLIRECILILEDIAKERLNQVGHPAIDGCDFWVISKNKIRKFFVFPKDYEVRPND